MSNLLRSNYYLPELEYAWSAYQDLKQIKQYRLAYEAYKYIQKNFKQYFKQKDWEEYMHLFDLLIACSKAIESKWGLKTPIDPNLSIEKEDLQKSIRPNSSLAKLIEAFDISPFPKTKKEKSISKQRLDKEKRVNKFTVYSMSRIPNITIRELARRFKVNKDTIKNWINEVDDWPKEERQAVVNEFLKHKHLYDIDTLHLSKHFKIPLSKVELGLNDKGIYKTGQKRIPKSLDEPTEETIRLASRHHRQIISL